MPPAGKIEFPHLGVTLRPFCIIKSNPFTYSCGFPLGNFLRDSLTFSAVCDMLILETLVGTPRSKLPLSPFESWYCLRGGAGALFLILMLTLSPFRVYYERSHLEAGYWAIGALYPVVGIQLLFYIFLTFCAVAVILLSETGTRLVASCLSGAVLPLTPVSILGKGISSGVVSVGFPKSASADVLTLWFSAPALLCPGVPPRPKTFFVH